MIRRSAFVTLCFLLAACTLTAVGCRPTTEEETRRSFFDAVVSGAFLPQHPWLEVEELFRSQAQERESEGWHVPFTPWFQVEDGWGGAEDWGAWGLSRSTRTRFFLRDTGPYDFFVTAMAPPGEERPQTVQIRLNHADAGIFVAGPDWQDHRLELPEGLLNRGWNHLELHYAYHLDGTLESDDRPLALAFERLGLVPPGHTPPGSGTGSRVYQDQEILVLEVSGSYIVPLDIPRDAVALEFDFVAPREEGTLLEVELRTVDGRVVTRVSLADSESAEADNSPRLDVTRHRGAQMLLVFHAGLPAGGRFTIRRPQILIRESASAQTASAPSERPPMILIVLDAARADHFGVYGYDRETTPEIDRLAAESLVFKNVVAECSYTLCSMPSLLSGLSYVEHGMVTKALVLSEEVTTLAESLKEAGYLTLGYTGNPNNSRVTGTEQGFDEFYEIWKAHPKHITRRVMERLAKDDITAHPFFLMLHYVPPHEPYAPDPEFDIFGDPGYSGPVTSDREFTRAVYSRKIELDEADLAEMVSLYDGNLKMADAIVGQILGFLKEQGIYDEALIIVTSDHGEAFLEHGRVGHNTTVYEEMMRVPLVMKLPTSWADRRAAADLDRLATLADVPPTLLDALGLEPSHGADRESLLSPDRPERPIFLRSANPTRPDLGVRSRRFKAVTQLDRPPELFDLEKDPEEKTNVFAEDPVLYTGLSLMLEKALRENSSLRAGVREGEISEKDKAMLRALGYL